MTDDSNVRPFRAHRSRPRRRSIKPPEWLTGAALEEWKALAPLLHELGTLDGPSAPGFAIYCQVLADIARLHRRIDALGLARSLRSGLWEALNATRTQALDFARAYMLTPASRSRRGRP